MKFNIAGVPVGEFTIVYGGGYRKAAEILREYIYRAAGAELPLSEKAEHGRHEIRVGCSSRACSHLKVEFDGIDNGGFIIKEALGNLLIRANSAEGIFNGVYEFLHYALGWRFLPPDIDFLRDENAEIDLPEGYVLKHNPAYEYRQIDWVCAQEGEWQRKNHVNFKDFNWVGFVHTLSDLAETHDPGSQPCLSDEKIYETVLKNVRKWLDENPKCKIISVSQNDNQNFCKCPKCAAADEEEGSHAGSLLRFVNRIADAIRDDYPDVSIDTLAYQYTRKAPLHEKPRDNVIIRLCSIECCFSHELGDENCAENAAFKHDIIEWGKISKRLYIWDYVTDFSYYIPSFPNFRVILGNMRFFAENNAAGMYPEGNYNSVSGEFGELRAYLLARSMWNPYMTDEEYYSLMNDFLRGYYGAGWEYVRKFIDFTLEKSKPKHFNIWKHPFEIIDKETYAEYFDEIEAWWNKAEQLADNDAVRDRVKKSRLQWTAVKLLLNPDENEGREFYNTLKNLGIRWNEWNSFKDDPDFTLPPTQWLK